MILFSDVTAVGAQGCQGSLQLRRRQNARARALLRTAVASSHAPLRTETLTSVYADLKGGAGQRGGDVEFEIGKDLTHPTPPSPSSFCVASSSLENREASKARAFSFYFNGW